MPERLQLAAIISLYPSHYYLGFWGGSSAVSPSPLIRSLIGTGVKAQYVTRCSKMETSVFCNFFKNTKTNLRKKKTQRGNEAFVFGKQDVSPPSPSPSPLSFPLSLFLSLSSYLAPYTVYLSIPPPPPPTPPLSASIVGSVARRGDTPSGVKEVADRRLRA